MRITLSLAFIALGLSPAVWAVEAWDLRADYERAAGLRERYEGLSTGLPEPATFIEDTSRFWYRRTVKGGRQFMVVDADTRETRPAFDHARLAQSLSRATAGDYRAFALPAQGLRLADKGAAVELVAESARWRCDLADYACRKVADVPAGFVQIPFACAPIPEHQEPVRSPDGKWEAVIRNYNLGVRPVEPKAETVMLSTDGSEGNCYDRASIGWSPDSSKLALYRVRPGYRRMVTFVQSSPEDQVQPKTSSRFYAKPGDVLDLEQPVLFDLASKRQTNVDNSLFPNPFNLLPLSWRKDSRGFTFEYNQRGHQVYRVIEVDAATGSARGDLRGAEDVLLLSPRRRLPHQLGQALSPRPERRRRSRLDVGARRMESPLSL